MFLVHGKPAHRSDPMQNRIARVRGRLGVKRRFGSSLQQDIAASCVLEHHPARIAGAKISEGGWVSFERQM